MVGSLCIGAVSPMAPPHPAAGVRNRGAGGRASGGILCSRPHPLAAIFRRPPRHEASSDAATGANVAPVALSMLRWQHWKICRICIEHPRGSSKVGSYISDHLRGWLNCLLAQSPALRTTARLRPSRFESTEDAELAELAALPPFTARPVRCAVGGCAAPNARCIPVNLPIRCQQVRGADLQVKTPGAARKRMAELGATEMHSD